MPDILSVVVVEDDGVARSAMASAVLRAPGLCLAGVASDVSDGLALLERERPDVALVDLGLPSGSGLEVVRAAPSLVPGCAVIVVSALGDERLVLSAIAGGAVGYLLKDAVATDLVAQVAVLRAGGSPVSPVIARLLLTRLGRPIVRESAGGAATCDPVPSSTVHVPEVRPELRLSSREQQVLRLCALGYTFDEIADRMAVSRHTVGTYIRRSYRKLQVHSKTEAVVQARQLGIF